MSIVQLSDDIDCVDCEYACFGLYWILIACNATMLKNDEKCHYIFMGSQTNPAWEGLIPVRVDKVTGCQWEDKTDV